MKKRLRDNLGIKFLNSFGEGIQIGIGAMVVGKLAETAVSELTDNTIIQLLAYFGGAGLIAIPRIITTLSDTVEIDKIAELEAKIAELEAKINE